MRNRRAGKLGQTANTLLMKLGYKNDSGLGDREKSGYDEGGSFHGQPRNPSIVTEGQPESDTTRENMIMKKLSLPTFCLSGSFHGKPKSSIDFDEQENKLFHHILSLCNKLILIGYYNWFFHLIIGKICTREYEMVICLVYIDMIIDCLDPRNSIDFDEQESKPFHHILSLCNKLILIGYYNWFCHLIIGRICTKGYEMVICLVYTDMIINCLDPSFMS